MLHFICETAKQFLEHVLGEFQAHITNEVASLRQILEQERQGSADIEEPALPGSAARFLTSPVHAN